MTTSQRPAAPIKGHPSVQPLGRQILMAKSAAADVNATQEVTRTCRHFAYKKNKHGYCDGYTNGPSSPRRWTVGECPRVTSSRQPFYGVPVLPCLTYDTQLLRIFSRDIRVRAMVQWLTNGPIMTQQSTRTSIWCNYLT